MLDSGVRRNDGARGNDETRRTARFALAARKRLGRGVDIVGREDRSHCVRGS